MVRGPERRQEESGTSTDVSRPGVEPGSQEPAPCATIARPLQQYTTGACHKAFDRFQGSCYTLFRKEYKKKSFSPAWGWLVGSSKPNGRWASPCGPWDPERNNSKRDYFASCTSAEQNITSDFSLRSSATSIPLKTNMFTESTPCSYNLKKNLRKLATAQSSVNKH